LHVKPPVPQLHAAENIDKRQVAFDQLCTDDLVRFYCNHCRWIDAECKKMCYDKLRELGYDATYKNQMEWSSSTRFWKLVQSGAQLKQFDMPRTQAFPYL